MLAEKKRRLKWCINPRGNQWSNDQAKFGQRLLEKMGWSAGQGLGINKQGPTEIVKVKKKNDSAGLGFKENGEKWLETTNEYNELLDQLASSRESEKDQADVSSSLEDRSKKSKARVHYQKFTRGKDLSQYSEKDLASIIGLDMVKYKSVDAINTDNEDSEINKVSLAKYLNSTKSAKNNESAASEPTINEDTTTNMKQDSSLDKTNKKSKNMREGDAQELNYKIKKSHKKSKKHKYDREKVADYQSYNDEDQNSTKIFKKKNKSLPNGILIETIEHINRLEVVKNSINSCTDSESVFKVNKKFNKIKTQNSIDPGVDHSIEDTCEKEKKDHCEKLSTNKKVMINDAVKRITNKSELETTENIKKMKKRAKGFKSELLITPAEDAISSCSTKYKDNLTYELSKNNIQSLGNNCTSCIDFENIDKVNVVSKKKKKIKQHNVQDNNYIEELDVENKHLFRKRKSENKAKIIDADESNSIKRKKGKEENIKHSTHEELYRVLNSELDRTPSSKEQLPKQSKRKNEPKGLSTFDTELNFDLIAPEKLLNVNKENKCLSETTSINNNEDITSKASSGCLTALGRKTRLRNLNITQNSAKHTNFVTGEFMAFSESKHVLSNKSSDCENLVNSKISPHQRIYIKPNNEDSNISMNVANYEYRLLTSKMKLLNIPTNDVKIIIMNNLPLTKKLHKKLKLLYKSKYYKSLLPANELASIEASIEEFAAKLQPKIDVIKELLEIENQTVKLGNETNECGILVDSNKKQTDKVNLTPEKQETLIRMKKQIKLLSNIGKGTINVTSRNNEESAKKITKMATLNSNYNNNNERVLCGGVLKEVSSPFDSLQTRIEERLSILVGHMKQLTEGHDKNNSYSNERKSSKWSKESQEGHLSTSNEVNNFVQTKKGSGPTYGRSGRRASSRGQGIRPSLGMCFSLRQGAVKSHLWGRGVQTVLRGRISKNNFDAKKYAMKCKFNNTLPEVTFKGVDLKVISGYAASDNEQSTIEPLSHKTNI